MKHDRIDKLLQLAWLEGEVRTHKAYEKSVVVRGKGIKTSEASKVALVRRMEQALDSRAHQQVPLTIGAFLKGLRFHQSLRAEEIFRRLGLTRNIYSMLEEDRVSPLKVAAESWKRLRTLLDLPADDLVEMIRRTHQLVFFRPAFRTTLARYDKRKKKGTKLATLEKAAVELYTRARLELPDGEKTRLNELIKAIRE